MSTQTLAGARALSVFLLGTALAACSGGQPPHQGQALARVNGEDITAMQLKQELQRAGLAPGRQDALSGQLLEALIDRQLLHNEAVREKLDRDPEVMQALERARALIVAQAYMQKKIGAIDKPSAAEVSRYYLSHPDFFSNRKQFHMQQLVLDTPELSAQARQAAEHAGTLDGMAAWLDAAKVKYVRAQATRTTSDLAPALSARLKTMAPGKLFVVREGPRSMFVTIVGVKDNPASLELAAPQIEQFLMAQRSKQAAGAELARLRAVARIEYLNQGTAPATAAGHADAAATPGVASLN